MTDNRASDLIDQIADQDFAKAGASLNDLLSDKMSSALDAERINIADTTFNGVEFEEEAEEVDEVDDDFDDEELDLGAEEAVE